MTTRGKSKKELESIDQNDQIQSSNETGKNKQGLEDMNSSTKNKRRKTVEEHRVAVRNARDRLKDEVKKVEVKRLEMLLTMTNSDLMLIMDSKIRHIYCVKKNFGDAMRENISSFQAETDALNQWNSPGIDPSISDLIVVIKCGSEMVGINPRRLLDFAEADLSEDIINAWVAGNPASYGEIYLSSSHWRHPKVDMTLLHYIVMPTFSKSHWFTTIIRTRRSGKTPMILICDSLKSAGSVYDNVKKLYENILKSLGNDNDKLDAYSTVRAQGVVQQKNGFDCGVCMLMTIQEFMKDPDDFFEKASDGPVNSEHERLAEYNALVFRLQLLEDISRKVVRTLEFIEKDLDNLIKDYQRKLEQIDSDTSAKIGKLKADDARLKDSLLKETLMSSEDILAVDCFELD